MQVLITLQSRKCVHSRSKATQSGEGIAESQPCNHRGRWSLIWRVKPWRKGLWSASLEGAVCGGLFNCEAADQWGCGWGTFVHRGSPVLPG